MSQELQYNKDVVRPWECFQEGWDMLKGNYWLLWAICFVGILVGSLAPLSILLGPMMCGIYLCFFAQMKQETVSMDTLFKGFNYFGESLVATFLQMGAFLLLCIPLVIIGFVTLLGGIMQMASPEGDLSKLIVPAAIFMTLFIILLIAFSTLFVFSYQLIVDKGLSGYEAVKISIKGASANIGGVLGLVVLGMVLGFIGTLFLYIGAFFVLPVIFAANAVAYRKVFPQQVPLENQGGPIAQQ